MRTTVNHGGHPTFFIDVIHRCRNRGGHDITRCSTVSFESGVSDLVCGNKKPLYRFCHMVGLNSVSTVPNFRFTSYDYFDVDSAHAACSAVGGSVPSLKNDLDVYHLECTMEYLFVHVKMGWPFSLKWISWPVRTSF